MIQNLQEYQVKALFKEYGMPVPNNLVANTPAEARLAAEKLSIDKAVVKAQIHARGRGRSGGVKLVDTPREAEDYAKSVLGTHLVTVQTGAAGQLVSAVLVEEICDIDTELYLGMAFDRASQRIVITASTEGGIAFEQVEQRARQTFVKLEFEPLAGVTTDQSQDLAAELKLTGVQIEQFTQLLSGLCKLFSEKNLAMVEINPLVITSEGNLVCLDGRIDLARQT